MLPPPPNVPPPGEKMLKFEPSALLKAARMLPPPSAPAGGCERHVERPRLGVAVDDRPCAKSGARLRADAVAAATTALIGVQAAKYAVQVPPIEAGTGLVTLLGEPASTLI